MYGEFSNVLEDYRTLHPNHLSSLLVTNEDSYTMLAYVHPNLENPVAQLRVFRAPPVRR